MPDRPPKKVERKGRLRWVPISRMRVSPLAQQRLRPYWVRELASDFNLDSLGHPVVNLRDGWYYIVDGQHRVEALKEIGWGDQQIQCEYYEGLTEAEEAELFLRLNYRKNPSTFSNFKVSITAGRLEECDIDRIVRAQGLRISLDKSNGAISAVGALRRVYQQSGPKQLARTLRIVRDAYGDAGLSASVINGIGLLCARYDRLLDDTRAVTQLSKAHGGVNGLTNRAAVIQRATGGTKYHSVAAAAVDIINSGKGGKKLPPWFRNKDSGDAA